MLYHSVDISGGNSSLGSFQSATRE